MRHCSLFRRCWYLLLIGLLYAAPNNRASAQEALTGFDLEVRQMAEACRQEIVTEMEKLLTGNRLTLAELFDTFYIPIPDTDPQKFRTHYDKYTDEVLRIILDRYVDRSERILFVVAVDRNGYLPTHNTQYSRPLTGNAELDTKQNRTKRIFNDRTGLAAARNTRPYLLQTYSRDTGEQLYDLSVPIFIRDRHWGALRFGYRH